MASLFYCNPDLSDISPIREDPRNPTISDGDVNNRGEDILKDDRINIVPSQHLPQGTAAGIPDSDDNRDEDISGYDSIEINLSEDVPKDIGAEIPDFTGVNNRDEDISGDDSIDINLIEDTFQKVQLHVYPTSRMSTEVKTYQMMTIVTLISAKTSHKVQLQEHQGQGQGL